MHGVNIAVVGKDGCDVVVAADIQLRFVAWAEVLNCLLKFITAGILSLLSPIPESVGLCLVDLILPYFITSNYVVI